VTSLRLNAALCSRLCHDLVGPVGAINNGLEVLAEEEDAEMRRQAIGLMTQSAREATGRLAFFRLAFGAGGAVGDEIGADEVHQIVADWFGASRRVRLEWQAAPGERLAKPVAKLLMNLLLVATAALPRGGTLTVDSGSLKVNRVLIISAAAPEARLTPELRDALASDLDDSQIDSHNVVAQLAFHLAREHKATLAVREASGRIDLVLTLSA
jgi:histidine phosphotransferase ChpT